MPKKQIVNVNVLPGEPLDGSGRVCIHLFVQDEKGPFVEPCVLHSATDEHGQVVKQQVVTKPTRGRLACDSRRTVAPTTHNSATTVTLRTDDPRGVTCKKCIVSKIYTEMVARLAELEAAR